MRKFSRWMPGAPAHKMTVWGWVVLALLAGGFLYLICTAPFLRAFVAVAIVLGCIAGVVNRHRIRKLAEGRDNDSICTFARAFDRRQIDPWILRAVYEELSVYVTVDGRAVPIRPDDRWEEDLKIDSEDMDALVRDIANRAGRSLKNAEQNRFYSKVKTVRDVVDFLEHQPRVQEQPPR